MRYFIFVLIISSSAYAQQNFFNVPSSDITQKGTLFFQEQINLNNDAAQSSTTLCYGLGKKSEIGFNLIGLNYLYSTGFKTEDNQQPYAPYFSLNFQKSIPISKWLKLGLGGQTGFNKQVKFGYYLYANLGFYIHHTHTKIIAGSYVNNQNYFGPNQIQPSLSSNFLTSIPLQLGFEQEIVKDKLLLQADFISGHHAMSDAVYGLAYFMNSNWILSAGFQVPNSQSLSNKAMVIEFTFLPK